jgi:hypothetical protein
MIALQVVMLFHMKGKVRFLSLALISVCIPFGCRRDRAQEVAAAPLRPELVTIPVSDGGTACADRYGRGSRAVVLAHGGRFDKESWAKQGRAGAGRVRSPGRSIFAATVVARRHVERGSVRRSRSRRPRRRRLAAREGATSVSIVGGSMGGGAAAQASTKPARATSTG